VNSRYGYELMGSLSAQLTGSSLKDTTPDEQNFTLPGGIKGNLKTIKFMQKVARERSGHPIVREFALKIIQAAGIPSHNYKEEALAIGDFVKQRMRYVRDPRESELLQDPVMLIEKLEKYGYAQGDCDDMALLIATLLLSTGHSPIYRAVRYKAPSGPFNHIYVILYERNYPGKPERVVLDAILKNKPIGSEINHRSGEDFII
jgi:hypothetical protein